MVKRRKKCDNVQELVLFILSNTFLDRVETKSTNTTNRSWFKLAHSVDR